MIQHSDEARRTIESLNAVGSPVERQVRPTPLNEATLLDVAMMLKTCAWALRRGTAPELGERALELLKKRGLLGSPLRTEALDDAGASAAARGIWPRLEKPARVGNGTFQTGVSSRLVIEAAQRQHEYAQQEERLTDEQAREHERNRRRLWDMMNGPVVHIDMKDAIEQAVQAERHACGIAVWMTLQDALADDADDKGLEGWMREAEARVKARP